MSEASSSNPNEAWRNFTITSPIGACRLTRADLKRLYRIVDGKQLEHRDRVVSQLFQTEKETQQEFQDRVTSVRNAFVTTVRVTDPSGQVITGHGEDFLDSPLFPERVLSVLYDTGFFPAAILKYTPSDRVNLLLDFSQPKPLNLAVQPSAPTPNNSNFFVTAEIESWSTSLAARLREFFAEKSTRVNWLHSPSAYDTLLIFLGFPLSLWGSYKLGNILLIQGSWPSPMVFGTYIYAFLLILYLFRAIFMYTRWIYPKAELAGEISSASTRHKAILAVIVLGVIGSAVWDGIRALTIH